MRKSKLTDRQIANLYLIGLLSASKIAELAGVSGVAIWKRLKRMDLPTAKYDKNDPSRPCATMLNVKCGFCKADLKRSRCRVLGREVHYCNTACQMAARINADREKEALERWTDRSKAAKWVKLTPDMVVSRSGKHLKVYSSEGDDILARKGRKVAPIWQGEVE